MPRIVCRRSVRAVGWDGAELVGRAVVVVVVTAGGGVSSCPTFHEVHVDWNSARGVVFSGVWTLRFFFLSVSWLFFLFWPPLALHQGGDGVGLVESVFLKADVFSADLFCP